MMYSETIESKPDWISPPGQTIISILEEQELSIEKFAHDIGQSVASAQKLIDGKKSINIELARKLASVLGATESFWMAREHDYRASVEEPEEVNISSLEELLNHLPVKDMQKFGWIPSGKSKETKLSNCLLFFGVSSLAQWQGRYENAFRQAAYRRSTIFENCEISTAAWLRQGEIATNDDVVGEWSPETLEKHIPNFKRLTWFKDPTLFLPKIKEYFAEAGVKFAVVRAPKGCTASGAVRLLEDGSPLVQLSFRFLSDDQFWFSLFHEIGHLLLHFDKLPFLECTEMEESEYENEANDYAKNTIIPMADRDEFLSLGGSRFPIIKYAKKVGVAPGLVVGQLQHESIIRYNQMQHLKRRFQWSD